MARQRITHAMLERQAQTLAERLGVPYNQKGGLTIQGESMGAVSISWELKSGGIKRLGNGVVSTREAYEQLYLMNDVLHWVKNLAAYNENPRSRNQSSERTRKYPVNLPPYKVEVSDERDNFDVWLSDKNDETIAHWHDDDARGMVEDGFFSDKGGKKLADSVVEYARSVGLIK